MPETQNTPAITGVHTVGIPVTDQDQAVAFYVDTLGLGVRLDRPLDQGARWIEVAPPAPPSRSRSNGHTSGTQRVSRRACAWWRATSRRPTPSFVPGTSTSATCCVGPACPRCSLFAIRTATGSRSSKAEGGWPGAGAGRRPTWPGWPTRIRSRGRTRPAQPYEP